MPRHEQVSPSEEGAPTAPAAPIHTAATFTAASAEPFADAPTTPPPPPTVPVPPIQAAPPVTPAAAPPPAALVAPPTTTPASGRSVNGGVAALLSFFMPGLGQLYAGQTVKGVVLLGITFFTCWGAGLLPFIAAADAYLIAERINRGESVSDFQIF